MVRQKSPIFETQTSQQVSFSLDMVNEDCWHSFIKSYTGCSTPFKDTLWEVEKIVEREISDGKVKYLLEWAQKNGRVFKQ